MLFEETAGPGFDVPALSADKNYCTRENVRWAKERGVRTFITVKKNAVRSKKGSDPAWDENFENAKSDNPDVKRQFHQRSRIESVNSVIKGKYEPEILSESATGQYNEALCKVICYNLITLIRQSRALGFTPKFDKW